MTEKKRDQPHTALDGHIRQGKVLLPPMLAIPGLQLASWMNSRLPEFLWVGLLQTKVPRLEVLDGIRALAPFLEKLRSPLCDLSITGLASVEVCEVLLPEICRQEHWRAALAPLRLLGRLPGLDAWAKMLPEPVEHEGWESLKIAVASMLAHQSEVATDSRWACVFAKIVAGFIHSTSESQDKTFREILAYPREGDLRKVRPMIRAIEGAFAGQDANQSAWPHHFWDFCLANSDCYPMASTEVKSDSPLSVPADRVAALRDALIERCNQTRSTSAIDPRHDGAFSLALYACSLLGELVQDGQGRTILSRLGLRTLLEATITLSYLMKHGTTEMWSDFRSFGAGQAKLALLKLSSDPNRPGSVDMASLEALASEDTWLEFVKIELSTWSKKDLRRLSDQCGLKDLYDRFYPWTSAYAHAQWNATRDLVFDTCGNALHRLHRIPRSEKRRLPDAVRDAAKLMDTVTGLIDRGFPTLHPLATNLVPSDVEAAISESVNLEQVTSGTIATLQDTLLELHSQVFEAFTGSPPEHFVPTGSTFAQEIRRLGQAIKVSPEIARRSSPAREGALRALWKHYEATAQQRLEYAQSLSGTKCVLGGQQSLTEAAVNAAFCSAAYFDAVLIPDPVHRWLEREPTEEGSPHVRMLEDIYNVAKLGVREGQPHAPFLLFPSFEKALEINDRPTQDGIERLIIDVCSGVLGVAFSDHQSLATWANENRSQFLSTATDRGLFVPCGGRPRMPVDEALELQRSYLREWRSESFQEAYGNLSDVFVVLMNITERLAPIFHLLDNATSFDASPVLSSPMHWHYFRLCFSVEASRLLGDSGIPLFPETIRAFEDLGDRGRPGGPGFSPSSLIAMRDAPIFSNFRQSLRDLLSMLDATTGSGVDSALRTVGLELPRLLSSIELTDRRDRPEAAGAALRPRPAALPWLPTLGAKTSLQRPFIAPSVLVGRVPMGFYFPKGETNQG